MAKPGVVIPLFDRAELLAEGYIILTDMTPAELARAVTALRSLQRRTGGEAA